MLLIILYTRYKTYVRDQNYSNVIIVLRHDTLTVIYELYVRSRITTGLLYSIFGLIIRVIDDGTVTFYREIKLKIGFGVVHCCDDKKYTCNS